MHMHIFSTKFQVVIQKNVTKEQRKIWLSFNFVIFLFFQNAHQSLAAFRMQNVERNI